MVFSTTQKELFLHVITGCMATAVHYGVMAAMLNWTSSAVGASSVGFVAGAFTRFLSSHKIVFSGDRLLLPALVRFVISILLQLLLNGLLLNLILLITSYLWIAQIVTTGMMIFFNFVVYKNWVFKRTASGDDSSSVKSPSR